jgi:hypothetical protein
VIDVVDIDQRPIRVLSEYFVRALEELGLKAWLGLLRPGKEALFSRTVHRDMESRVLSWRLELDPIRVLHEPNKFLSWEPHPNPEQEISSHYQLQWAILAAVMGLHGALETLAAQLVTEPMNRKLTIAYFLGNLTEGRVGSPHKELPTKAQILQWLEEIEHIQLQASLGEIAQLQLEAA